MARITIKSQTELAVTECNGFQPLTSVTSSSNQDSAVVVVLDAPSTLCRKTQQNSRSYHIPKFNSLTAVIHYAFLLWHLDRNQSQERYLITCSYYIYNILITFPSLILLLAICISPHLK